MLDLFDPCFYLAHAVFARQRLGEQGFLLALTQGEHGARVSHFDVAAVERVFDRLAQFEQAQDVGHGGAGTANELCRFFVGEVEVLYQLLQGAGDFEDVEVAALQVFDEGDGQRLLVVVVFDDAGDFRQPRNLAGAEAAFAGDDFVLAVGNGTDDQRLQDAVFGDGLRQFLQGVVVEDFARLIDAGTDFGGVNLLQRFKFGLGDDVARRFAEQ